MSEKDKTGESGPDFTYYDELKQQAITETDGATRVIAGRFVPVLYEELIKQRLSPHQAASKIYKDFVPTWAHDTIHKLLPSDAHDKSRAVGGIASGAARKIKQITHEILLTHDVIMEINNVSTASVDHSVLIVTNAKLEFETVKPAKPKPVNEPLTVKTSSAPVRPT